MADEIPGYPNDPFFGGERDVERIHVQFGWVSKEEEEALQEYNQVD